MRIGLLVAALAAGTLAASSARALPRQLEQCLEAARGDPQATQCWSAERERQDQRVAELHRRLLRYLRTDAERRGFDQAQSAWQRFRDASCAWERRAMVCCDMTEQLAEDTCRVERSEARAADLERLVAAFGPGGPLSTEPAAAGAPGAKGPADGMIFPDSSERLLVPADLSGMSREQLRLARNEIYARRGRIFDSPDLQEYFGRQPWYRPVTREVALTPIERANVTLLEGYERRR